MRPENINHRSLWHPNMVRFKEVLLTPTHLAILMEYATGGELFELICEAGRFSADEVCSSLCVYTSNPYAIRSTLNINVENEEGRETSVLT